MKRNVFIRASGVAVLIALSVQAFAAEKTHTNVNSKDARWADKHTYQDWSKNLKALSEKPVEVTVWKDNNKSTVALTADQMNKAWTWSKLAREYRIQNEALCEDSDKAAKWWGQMADMCFGEAIAAPIANGMKETPWKIAFDAATLSACNQEMEWYFGWKDKQGKLSEGDKQLSKDMKKAYGWFIGGESGYMTVGESFSREKTKEGVDKVLAKGKEIRDLVKTNGYNKENICVINTLTTSGLNDSNAVGANGNGDCTTGYNCAKPQESKPAKDGYGQVAGGVPAVQPYSSANYGGGGFYDPNQGYEKKKDGYAAIAPLMSGLYDGKDGYKQPTYIPPAAPPGAAAGAVPAAAAPIIPGPGPVGYPGGGVGVAVGVRKNYPPPLYPQQYPQIGVPLPPPVAPPPPPPSMPKKAKVRITVKESSPKPKPMPMPVPQPVPFQIPGRPGWWITVNGQVRPFVPVPAPVPGFPIRPVTPGGPVTPTYPVPPVPPVTPVYPTPTPTPGVGTPNPIRNRIPRTTSR